jgi:pilus assembly protein CpaE
VRNLGQGRSAAAVVLVGLTGDEMGQVREALVGEAALPSNPVSFHDALTAVQRTQPEVVIVSFSQGSEAPLSIAPAILRDLPGCSLVALSDVSAADAILSAMRVGYKEFVVLPADTARLRQVVHEAAYAPDSDDDAGTVISFVGAKGGVGTTMVTVQSGAELAGLHKVVAIDLDMSMGDLASMLDLQPNDDVVSLLPRAARMDERMLTSACGVHSSRLHVLAQPAEPAVDLEYQADDVYSILATAARAYQYVLIDAGSHIDTATSIASRVSDLNVIVTEPNVISVRNAFRRIRYLSNLGVERDRMRLVVNRAHAAAYVSNADIETNLGLPISAMLSDDPVTVGQAMNEGKLVRDVNRRAPIAKDLSSLLAMLTDSEGPAPVQDKAGASGGFLFGLFGRRA